MGYTLFVASKDSENCAHTQNDVFGGPTAALQNELRLITAVESAVNTSLCIHYGSVARRLCRPIYTMSSAVNTDLRLVVNRSSVY